MCKNVNNKCNEHVYTFYDFCNLKKYNDKCCISTLKPVLRGHLWDKEKVPYKTGDLLKEVQFLCNFL